MRLPPTAVEKKTEADPTQRARKNNFSTAYKFVEIKKNKKKKQLRRQSHVYMWDSL